MTVEKLKVCKQEGINETLSNNLNNSITFESFKKGSKFFSSKDLITKFNQLCHNNFITTVFGRNIRMKDCSIDKLLFEFERIQINCIHFGDPRPSSSKNIRPNQSTLKTGCSLQLKAYFQKTQGCYVITEFCTSHNHNLSKISFQLLAKNRRLTNEEIQKVFVNLYINIGISKKNIKESLKNNHDKICTTTDLKKFKK